MFNFPVIGDCWDSYVHDCRSLYDDIKFECYPLWCQHLGFNVASFQLVFDSIAPVIVAPSAPMFSSSGWLLPLCANMIDENSRIKALRDAFKDLLAGVVVALTLIPQAMSYASLANLPPIVGLYASIIPLAMYAVFGSSSTLSVGPVAIVSLLMGNIMGEMKVDSVQDPSAALDLAAQSCFCCGCILILMSLLNTGHLIRFLSHSVLSGFTTAAACLIGFSQLKNAFGFTNAIPRVGDASTHYNIQVMIWYLYNFNGRYGGTTEEGTHLYRNFYATRICIGLYVPLFLIYLLKRHITELPGRKKNWWLKCCMLLCNLSSFIGIILSALIARDIIENGKNPDGSYRDYYAETLSIVGVVETGLDIFKVPTFRFPFGTLFVKCIPVALIGFVESYSVARKLAKERHELQWLDCNQELFGIGMCNVCGSLFSGYPTAGSYSRSSLNHATGAKTQLSSVCTLLVICIALGTLASAFYYIPSSALSAVIWVAVINIISVSDFWEAWKHSKKDFCVMVVTFLCTFFLDTVFGLIIGVCVSLMIVLFDQTISKYNTPMVKTIMLKNGCMEAVEVSGGEDGTKDIELQFDNGHDLNLSLKQLQWVRIGNDLSFITTPQVKDIVWQALTKNCECECQPTITSSIDSSLCKESSVEGFELHPLEEKRDGDCVVVDTAKHGDSGTISVSTTAMPSTSTSSSCILSTSLHIAGSPSTSLSSPTPVTTFVLVLDFMGVKHVDLTGLFALSEVRKECKMKNVFFLMTNTTTTVHQSLEKFGIASDTASDIALVRLLRRYEDCCGNPGKLLLP